MLIAHITDTHITSPGTLLMGIVDTASTLERAVAALNRLDPSPDTIVLTGDLVESGAPEEYAHLQALLAPLRMPVFVIPGDHDSRQLHLWRDDGLVTHTAVIGDWPGPYSLRPTG